MSQKRKPVKTPKRIQKNSWRRLCAITEALAALRKKIADVLSDASGAKLEALALALPTLLEAVPTKKVRSR